MAQTQLYLPLPMLFTPLPASPVWALSLVHPDCFVIPLSLYQSPSPASPGCPPSSLWKSLPSSLTFLPANLSQTPLSFLGCHCPVPRQCPHIFFLFCLFSWLLLHLTTLCSNLSLLLKKNLFPQPPPHSKLSCFPCLSHTLYQSYQYLRSVSLLAHPRQFTNF